jgi:hypothetical protein
MSCSVAAVLTTDPAQGGPNNTPQLPDLVPHPESLRQYYVSHEEGRVRLRFPTTLINAGDGPLEVRGRRNVWNGPMEAYQRLYSGRRAIRDLHIGHFEHHATHHHWHLMQVAQYRLLTPRGDLVATSEKISFCMVDSERFLPDLSGSPRTRRYRTCAAGARIRRLTSGISAGWGDVYSASLPDQWVDVTGVPPGNYVLQIEIDPDGLITEKSDANNVASVPVTLR